MLATLVQFSIRHFGIVVLIAALTLFIGSYRFSTAGLDIFPEFSPKQVVIQTEAPGLSAEQVEILITQPIETSLSGLIGMHTIRSESIQGLSIITILFAENSDTYRNRQQVSERLTGIANQLPDGVAPVQVPLSSSSATVLTIGLTSDQQSLMDLRALVDFTLVPRLLTVSGVADVNVFGGEVRQLQIQFNPETLRRFNLSVDDIVTAATQAGSLSGAGFIENSNQRFTLQLTGQAVTPEQFKHTLIKRLDGTSISLGEVCEINYAAEAPIGAAQIMGKPGIVLMIIGQYGANTLTVSRQVETVLAEFAPLLEKQAVQLFPHLFRPADYIETSLKNLSSHLLIGALFVLLILYLFLFNFRTALISALAIPLSLVGAVIVLLEVGVNLNIMVLGGLAIALGEVVDDAIIDSENIFRRLRENQLSAVPKPISRVVYQASMEVRGSVVYASFIVALVFVPLLTLSGVAGRLFSPLGYSYILAILMSLLVALTLTPALCYVLLGKRLGNTREPPLIRCLNPIYRRQLRWVTRHFRIIMLSSLLICGFGVASLFQLDHKFLPELREGHYIIHTTSLPGTSLQESIRIGTQLTQQFLTIPGIASVSQWAGRAERGADTYGSHYSEYEVRLKPMSGAQQQQVLNRLRGILGTFPGIQFEANTFLTERIDETISGYTSPVVVNIYGHDLNQLDQMANRTAGILRQLPGTADVQVRSPSGTAMIQVAVNLERLRFYGLNFRQVMNALQTAYEGRRIGKNIRDNQIYSVAVVLTPALRHTPESIAQLSFKNNQGQRVTLQQIAEIRHTEGRYNILHQGAQRKQTVTANILDRDMEAFMQELKSRVVNEITFPQGSYPEFTGAALEQAEARRNLLLHSLLAGCAVLLLIYIAIGSLRHMLLTLINLPFALIGGVIAVIVSGSALSVGSVVGFVTLFGITVRNTIMLISHYRHLIETDGRPWNIDTVIQGAQERLPSILMTALVTALAMFPIAVDSDNPGLEIMGPMAAIIIGGLVSSTLLNLLVLPSILLRYGRFQKLQSSHHSIETDIV